MIRKTHFLCLFFLFLLFIGTASANEDSNNSTLSNTQPTLETTDIDMYYKDGTSFNVKLVGNDGAISGEKINITINGITYNRVSNSSGESKLNLNLAPGEYKIKTDCILNNNLLSVLNTIKIKQMNTTLMGDKICEFGFKEDKYGVTLMGGNGKLLENKQVIFSINGVEYSKTSNDKGIASLNINLAPGEYKISAKFSENHHTSSFISSTIFVKVFDTQIAPFNVKINKSNCIYSVKLTDSINRPVKNHDVLFCIDGSNKFVETDNNGIATLNVVLAPGKYDLKFQFLGSSGFSQSIGFDVIEIDYSGISISSNDFETCVDNDLFYFVLVNNENGEGISNITIKTDIFQDGRYIKTIESKTYEDGIARIIFNLNSGQYTVKNYIEQGKVTCENKIIIRPASLIIESSDLQLNRKGEYYTIIVKNNETNLPVSDKNVVISINGVSYKRVTDKNGMAKLKINLNEGIYCISYYVDGNGKYSDIKGNNTIKMINSRLPTELSIITDKIIRKGSYFEAQLKDSNKLPLSNQEVYISINGVTYKKITDENGTARLTINLNDGLYNVLVDFKDVNLFLASHDAINLLVNTTSKFNYTLELPRYLYFNGIKSEYIRHISVDYEGNVYNFQSALSEDGLYEITDKKSYFISKNNLESTDYLLKQGLELKIDNNNLNLIFYGKTSDIGQFSVIFSSNELEVEKIEFIIDNKRVVTVYLSTFYFYDEYMNLLDNGYSFRGYEFINSTFKFISKEIKRSVQFTFGFSGVSIKNNPKFDNFDTIQTYIITSKKITEDVIQKAMDNALNFNGGYEKYAYELFLSTLTTMWIADNMANNIANDLEVQWYKKEQVILANLDWIQLSLDSIPTIEVYGSENNVRLFKINYGILFSLAEELGLQATGNDASSAVSNIFNKIYEGHDFIIDEKGDFLTLRLVNSSDEFIINKVTGDSAAKIAIDIDRFSSDLILKGSLSKQYTSSKVNIENIFGFLANTFKRQSSDIFKLFSSVKPNQVMFLLKKQSKDAVSIVVSAVLNLNINPILLIGIGSGTQQITLDYRNKYAPDKYWQYFASHGPITDLKTIAVVNKNTHYIDYVEIPYIEGTEEINFNEAIYVDSVYGKRNLTDDEKNKYMYYDV